MPIHSTEDMQLKLDQALQTIEVLKQRVDESHNKYDTLMELFQAYIRKDYDEATPRQQRRNMVRVVYCIKIVIHLTINLQESRRSSPSDKGEEPRHSNETILVRIIFL